MSRYIDADNALRMIRNSKRDCPLKDEKRGIWYVAHDCAISCVEAAIPSADVVEVVRCKDCKHIETTEYGGYCCLKKIGVAYNDYCSYGERREECKPKK